MHAFWLVLTYDLVEDRCIDDVIIKTFLNSQLYKTNRFQVAVRLFSNRSQMTSKCGENINDTLGCTFCSYHILTSSVIYYWTDPRQFGIYLLIWALLQQRSDITCLNPGWYGVIHWIKVSSICWVVSRYQNGWGVVVGLLKCYVLIQTLK